MKIEILDIDRLIEANHLQEVTSHHIYSSKLIFDEDGLFSNRIFGLSKAERRTTFAYVSLRRKFIHPHIYGKVLKGVFRNIVYLVAGQKYFSIRNGLLVEDPDNGWTGLANLYDHWDEIQWSKLPSANKTSKELLSNLHRDKVFLDKFLICPPAYRDISFGATGTNSDKVDPLNDLYSRLIRTVALLNQGGLFSRTQYATQLKVQDTLWEIYDFFKDKISSKNGIIRRNLIGKSVDYGVRAVISANAYNNEKFEDSMVDLEHSAVPIAMCCSLFYPFIEAWLKNFFTGEIINDPDRIRYYNKEKNQAFTAPVHNPEVQFSDKAIKKMINDYCLNPDNRFRLVTVDVDVPAGKDFKHLVTVNTTLMLIGKRVYQNTVKDIHRMMTITDLLYLACVDVTQNRHVMVSRYPVGTDKGIHFDKINVQSTIKHMHIIFNGKDYPNYPYIDFNTQPDDVAVQFVDTLVMSSSHCDGMGADFDGDQVSIRGLYSDEANAEAEKIMNQKTSALNINGANSKVVAKEVFNSLYELTKAKPTNEQSKAVNSNDVRAYLSMTPQDITRSFLVQTFADTVDCTDHNVAGKRKSKYNTWDTMNIPRDYFYKGQQAQSTTIGRFVYNKFLLEGAGVIAQTGYHNEIMNKSATGKMDTLIGQLYLQDKITRPNYNAYTDRRDTLGFWLNGLLAHTISEKMSKPIPAVEKKKAELIKKYEKEIADHDVDVMNKISNELVAYAKDILKDDPGMDLYDSGDLDFGNNYKNNSILKGPVLNKITGDFDFIGSSFMDGIEIKDIPAHANSIVASQYPASVATQQSGYMGKKLLALMQMMEIDEPGTDCHTKQLIPIKITNVNKQDMLYTYISKNREGRPLILLEPNNIDLYVGQSVWMRSPMTCINDKICSVCAGKLFEMLGVKNPGLYSVALSHADLNLNLKSKHDSTIKLFEFDPNEILERI